MKKLLLGAAILLTGAASFAQTKIAEGTITYAVEYDLPDNMKPYAAFFPKEAVIYFKGDSSIVVQKSTGGATSTLMNSKTDFMKILMDRQGKKLAVNFSPADIEEIQMNKPEYTYTAGSEETLATYKGTKYMLKDAKGVTADAIFTKAVILPVNSMSVAFDTTYGTPLSFTVNQGGMSVKAVVKEIKAEKVPAGIFSVPAGYEPITLTQFKAMNGGK